MTRMAHADEKADPQLAEVYDQITRTRGYVSNILKSYSNAPEGLKAYAGLGEYVRYRTDIPGRTRELVILALARGNQYAWSHHHPHALKAGIAQAELDALNEGRLADTLSGPEKAAVRYAQEFGNGGNVSDATFAELKKHYSARQITDLTLIGCYFLALATTINAFRIQLEPDFKPTMKPVA